MSSTSNTSDQLFLLDNREDLLEHLIKVLSQGRRDIAIFSRSLNSALFNQDEVISSLSSIARLSRQANIRIVIENPQAIIDAKHKLLPLCHRLTSKIKIQRITIEPQDDYEFVIVDTDKLWLQHAEGKYSGFANYAARPEVKRFLTVFNDLWKHSEEDSRLRNLLI